jgi:hypothetical protein
MTDWERMVRCLQRLSEPEPEQPEQEISPEKLDLIKEHAYIAEQAARDFDSIYADWDDLSSQI